MRTSPRIGTRQRIGTLPCVATLAALLLAGLAAAAGSARSGQDPTPEGFEVLLEQARPGPEHERLSVLEGDWDVQLAPFDAEEPLATGQAQGRALLGGRFLELSGDLGEEAGQFRFTLGFDRRHGEFTLTLIDTSGTYAVSARGPEQDGRIRMRGTDDDPYMASLGLDKEFLFELVLLGDDAFRIELYFVDTRTEARRLLAQVAYSFERR